jgi:hypothetical protein
MVGPRIGPEEIGMIASTPSDRSVFCSWVETRARPRYARLALKGRKEDVFRDVSRWGRARASAQEIQKQAHD